MQYLWRHTRAITDSYTGNVPLTHYLRAYCKQHPVLGSRDRRMLSALVYSWYRCSKGVPAAAGTYEQRMRQCLRLCNADGPEFERMFANVPAPAQIVPFDAGALFPYDVPLSDGIDRNAWLASMLVQPRLFIRIRKDGNKLRSVLRSKEIEYEEAGGACLSLPNGAPIDTLLPADSYVVQDASSQQTGHYFHPAPGERWYDCCSGAGGKSLLLVDQCPSVHLTVSDKRQSILNNLTERFRLYGHKRPAVRIADVAAGQQAAGPFDNIISDVPCSGSGTWARTPEQMYFFSPAGLAGFPPVQQAIATNVAGSLRKGGRLFYITCSVFRQENEDVVSAITAATTLQLQEMRMINGLSNRADSMFVALLQKMT